MAWQGSTERWFRETSITHHQWCARTRHQFVDRLRIRQTYMLDVLGNQRVTPSGIYILRDTANGNIWRAVSWLQQTHSTCRSENYMQVWNSVTIPKSMKMHALLLISAIICQYGATGTLMRDYEDPEFTTSLQGKKITSLSCESIDTNCFSFYCEDPVLLIR